MKKSRLWLFHLLILCMMFSLFPVSAVLANEEGEGEPVGIEQPENLVTVRKASADKTKYRITITNARYKGKAAKKVKVKTWSQIKGKDDAKVYTAKKISDDEWSVTVNVRKFKHGGKFIANIYVNGKKVTSVQYKMSLEKVRKRLYAQANRLSSSTKWVIVVDRTTHRVGIFKGKKGSWTIQKCWKCGDGKPSSPTPDGTYSVKSKGPYFDSFGDRVYYYTEFTRHYYFHSVCCDPRTGEIRPGTQLGEATSHGCVRLAMNNAKWLMNHVPYGSTVYVFH